MCEIACRPVGAGFYLGLGQNVADGTGCDETGQRVCISGQCRVSAYFKLDLSLALHKQVFSIHAFSLLY